MQNIPGQRRNSEAAHHDPGVGREAVSVAPINNCAPQDQPGHQGVDRTNHATSARAGDHGDERGKTERCQHTQHIAELDVVMITRGDRDDAGRHHRRKHIRRRFDVDGPESHKPQRNSTTRCRIPVCRLLRVHSTGRVTRTSRNRDNSSSNSTRSSSRARLAPRQ